MMDCPKITLTTLGYAQARIEHLKHIITKVRRENEALKNGQANSRRFVIMCPECGARFNKLSTFEAHSCLLFEIDTQLRQLKC